MWRLFTPHTLYRKRARLLAILWTLLIFVLCLWPSKELPTVDVPLADKWAHFLLFAVLSFFWLCTWPNAGPGYRVLILLGSIGIGALVEWLQLSLPALGRSFEFNDIIANSIGAILGLLLFYLMRRVALRQMNNRQQP